MSPELAAEAMDFIKDHFLIIEPLGGTETLEYLFEKFEDAVVRYGVKGVLIDPWNRIDHQYAGRTMEEYQSQALNSVERFLQKHSLYGTYRDWETDRKSTRLNSSHRL